MKYLHLLLIIISFYACEDKQIPKPKYSTLESKINLFYRFNVYDIHAGAPFHTKRSQIPHPYLYLRDSTSIKELKALTDHYLGVVRIYSFKALVEKQDSSIYRILIDHLSDTFKINMFDIDVFWTSTVIDEMISLFLTKLKTIEKVALRDSILLNLDYLENIKNILFNIKPLKKYYKKVKELAENNHSEEAYIALAAYRNKDDINTLKKGLKNLDSYYGRVFKIIELFNDKAFIPNLIFYKEAYMQDTIYNAMNLGYYFNALAKFQRRECFDILIDLCKRQKYDTDETWKETKQSIFYALSKYNCPMYKSILQKFKKEGYPLDDYYPQFDGNPETQFWWK